jgi:hypothetical protein
MTEDAAKKRDLKKGEMITNCRKLHNNVPNDLQTDIYLRALGFQIFKITNVWIGPRVAKTFTTVKKKYCREVPNKGGNDADFKVHKV